MTGSDWRSIRLSSPWAEGFLTAFGVTMRGGGARQSTRAVARIVTEKKAEAFAVSKGTEGFLAAFGVTMRVAPPLRLQIPRDQGTASTRPILVFPRQDSRVLPLRDRVLFSFG